MDATYVKVTAEEAANTADVECYSQSGWQKVFRVSLDGDTAAVRYVNGGTHVAPAHLFTFRRADITTRP